MHLFEKCITKNNLLIELDSSELQSTFGGDPFSEAFYFGLGYLFEKFDQAARIAAPKGNTFKHSG